MDFTDIFTQTNSAVHFSPGGYFILSAVKDRLVVRRPDRDTIVQTRLVDCSPSATTAVLSKKSVRTASSDGWITNVAWSPDSEYILAAVAKRGIVMVYSMRDEEWSARIETGVEGLIRAEWAPDSRNILCFSEWGLRVTVWNLASGSATYIQYPKYPDKGYAFRKDGRYFVLVERHKSRDMMGVYNCAAGYKLVKHFALPTTSIASVALSPTGNHIAIWESAAEFKVVIMNLVGQHLATFVPSDDPLLGVRQVVWHPSGQYLIIGGWDTKIYIISSFEWRQVGTIQLSARLPSGTELWREPPNWQANTHNRGFLPLLRTSTTAANPGIVSVTKPSAVPSSAAVANASPTPKSGVTHLQFSVTGSLLLATWEQSPHVAFIYNFPSPSEGVCKPRLRSAMQCELPILHARMSSRPTLKGTTVAICTGNSALYMWNDDRVTSENERGELAECVSIPVTTEKKFAVMDVRWSLDGKGLLLIDKSMFCAAFEVDT